MSIGERMETLFQCASEYRFDDFDALFAQLEGSRPGGAPAEAYLMRAQIRLFAADVSLAEDLERAAGAAPAFPSLNTPWVPGSPNRFVAFGRGPGALERFLGALPRAEAELGRLYGEAGSGMVRQIHSEILYYRGAFGEALALAEAQGEGGRPADGMLADYVRFRCFMATGALAEAEACMLGMIQTSRDHPECVDIYRVVRDWANLTTGWSGDSPRFLKSLEGETLPVLEDRLAAIRKGISQLEQGEGAFAQYAARGREPVCTMREHYMDIFHALYWFQTGDNQQTATHFEKAYVASAASGLVMPFVEYGRQIVPLLQGAQNSNLDCSEEWICRVARLAEQYEENLEAYRS